MVPVAAGEYPRRVRQACSRLGRAVGAFVRDALPDADPTRAVLLQP